MNALSIILLALIGIWFIYALIHTIRTKGCGCGGCTGDCAYCGCASCKQHGIKREEMDEKKE